MANDFKCPICGEPTRVYMGNARKDRLCGKHADMLKAGEIAKCENCGKFYKTANGCSCSKRPERQKPVETQTMTPCPICGSDARGKEVCFDCYHEIMEKQQELDKNQSIFELKDYFYNLNSSIYRLKNNDYAIGQVYKLYAIAWVVRDLYNDNQLSAIVTQYAKKIIEARKKVPDLKITSERDQSDKATIAATNIPKNRSSDGHLCKSRGEVIIDNYLYNNHIIHAYGLKVKEIDSVTERTVEADWYIPLKGTDGIYIEYWGMDKQDYQDNKEEKLKLYEKHNIKLIEIEKDDPYDSQNFEYRLYRALKEHGWSE